MIVGKGFGELSRGASARRINFSVLPSDDRRPICQSPSDIGTEVTTSEEVRWVTRREYCNDKDSMDYNTIIMPGKLSRIAWLLPFLHLRSLFLLVAEQLWGVWQ